MFSVEEKIMTDDIKCLRILLDNFSLKDIFKEDFLKKIEENFKEYDVLPIGLAFALKNGEITEDMISISYRNDDEIKDNIALVDVQTNPENLAIIKKVLE